MCVVNIQREMQTRIEWTGGEGQGVSQTFPDNGPILILCPDDLSNENTIVWQLLITSFNDSVIIQG